MRKKEYKKTRVKNNLQASRGDLIIKYSNGLLSLPIIRKRL